MVKKRDEFDALARRHGCTLPVVAMAFALMPKAVTKIAVGVKSDHEVELNCDGLRQTQQLTKALWDASLLLTGCLGDGSVLQLSAVSRLLDSVDAQESWKLILQEHLENIKGKVRSLLPPDAISIDRSS